MDLFNDALVFLNERHDYCQTKREENLSVGTHAYMHRYMEIKKFHNL